ncbi:MAG: hypothetical protein V1819_03285 [bacterium]
MKEVIKAISTLALFALLLLLAIWLSPFIIIGVFIYLGYIIYRARKRKQIIEQIKKEWFPKGKNAFFVYSSSKKWKSYFEQELIPKIQSKVIIWNWSTRHQQGWNNNLLEAKVLKFFRSFNHIYPLAIVFLPSGKVRIFDFYDSYIKMLKSQNQNQDYKNLEKELSCTFESL